MGVSACTPQEAAAAEAKAEAERQAAAAREQAARDAADKAQREAAAAEQRRLDAIAQAERDAKAAEEAAALRRAEAVAVLPPAWLKDRIVLIGLTSPGGDSHRTPLSLGDGATSGVDIQAQVLAQMLDHRPAPLVGLGWRAAVVAVLALAGAAVVLGGWPVAVLAVVAVAGLALIWLAAGLAALLGGPIMSPLAPGLAWLAAVGAMSAVATRRERKARSIVMGLFAAHLSAPVADDIWRHRGIIMQGGRPRPQSLVATVMFSDIENFTPASERLGPERLMAWLETYMEAMTTIVTEQGGVVLRFIGDGILAAFGVPLPRTDQAAVADDALAAVRAALAMETALHPVNAAWLPQDLPPVCIRIGMVTGAMVAGSLGARQHLEYTVMGDTVNIAARLEALAKTVAAAPGSPCRILAARATWDLVAAAVEGRAIGEMELKGKAERVAVYQILGLRSGTASAALPPNRP